MRVKFSTLNCRRDHCVKRGCQTNPEKPLQKLRLRKEQKLQAKSVYPNEMVHMSYLIWTYTVFPGLFRSVVLNGKANVFIKNY